MEGGHAKFHGGYQIYLFILLFFPFALMSCMFFVLHDLHRI